jgi:hypothetical protein
MKFLFGADPEVFVSTPDGKFISAHGLIPGTKEEPWKVKDGAVQVDGMALEFNINPARDEIEFLDNIRSVESQLKEMVGDLQLHHIPTCHFEENVWINTPNEAKILGCDPDFDAWRDGAMNNPPNDGGRMFRTGAGHIHIGWTDGASTEDVFQSSVTLTRGLDLILNTLSPLWDDDEQRASLYGAPGAFRPKPYGMEYRVLSNAWLKSDKLITQLVKLTKTFVEEAQDKKLDWVYNFKRGFVREYRECVRRSGKHNRVLNLLYSKRLYKTHECLSEMDFGNV